MVEINWISNILRMILDTNSLSVYYTLMNKKITRALYIGRFQPFHLGHLSALDYIIEDSGADEVIIAIGSANFSHTPSNPFSSKERKKMLEESIKIEKFYSIFELSDNSDNDIWTSHLLKTLPEFETVYSNHWLVIELLEAAGKKVKPIPFKLDISGTQIRDLIKIDGDWAKFVPEGTLKVVKKLNGEKRIKEIKN